MPRNIDLYALAGVSRPSTFTGQDAINLQIENILNEILDIVEK